MDRPEAEEYASWFRCLADAARLQLLRILAEATGAMNVGELVDAAGVGQSSVSGYVRRLAESEFVLVERAGPTTYVSIDADCLRAPPDPAAAIMGGPPTERPAVAAATSQGVGT